MARTGRAQTAESGMVGFWISAGAMVLMVALLLFQALRQAQAAGGGAEGSADLAVYRDQLAEIGRDLDRGVLDQGDAARLVLEVQRRMLEADRPGSAAVRPAASWSFGLGLGALVVCLGVGVVSYVALGVPGYPDLPLSLRLSMADEAYQSRPTQDEAEGAQPAFVPPADLDPELAAMIDKLRAAVQTRPGDLLGHTLLAQNEAALGNYGAARRAQEVVVRLKGDDVPAEDLSALVLLMVQASGGVVTPQAEAVLIRCLQIDPGNGWARYYSGLMFAQIGRPDRAFALWEPLLREGPATAPWLRPVSALIDAVAQAAGIAFDPPALGPDAAAVAAAGAMTAPDRQALFAGMVEGLESRLKAEGGTVDDWARLVTSLGVLNEGPRARAAYAAGQAALAGRPGDLAALRAAAVAAGVAE